MLIAQGLGRYASRMNKPIPLRPDPSALRNAAIQCLTRAAIATARAEIEHHRDGARIARQLWPDDRTTFEFVQRAASAFATTGDAAWAGPLATVRVQELLTNLGPLSIGGRLLQKGITFSFDGNYQIKVPGISVSAGYTTFVGEGKPIPVHQLPVSPGAILTPSKLATIVTLTHEMVVSSDAEALVRAVLVDAVAASLDVALFGNVAADTTRPAGLLWNVTPLTASTGTGIAAMWDDLAALATAVAPLGGADIVYVTSPGDWVKITFAAGPQFKLPVYASSGVPAKTIIALAPNALASATDPAPRLEASRDAMQQMEDTAPADPALPAGVPLKSMFQIDSVSIRLTMLVSWATRATGAVAYVQNVSW
jgi:hypothetical protein